jgi:hypothetical protein
MSFTLFSAADDIFDIFDIFESPPLLKPATSSIADRVGNKLKLSKSAESCHVLQAGCEISIEISDKLS